MNHLYDLIFISILRLCPLLYSLCTWWLWLVWYV